MKRYRYIFFLLFSLVCINLNAQTENTIAFPVTGSFTFEPQVGQVKNFNKVEIESNTFHLKMDNQIVRSYRAIEIIKGGFSVEQFYQEGQSVGQDIERFFVDISSITEIECFFTINYPQGSEVIHLIRE
ncbi:MAG: hypothetical protein ORN50_00770 [Crocinitomicaceae bacterium]|nr:hypothetical protein [Crocinitomicaceae bacterium]